MKRNRWLGIIFGMLAMGALAGCAKDPASVDLNADDEAIRQLVEENQDYITSAGIDDDGAQPVSYIYDGLGKINAEITPLKFGRRGTFKMEHLSVDYEGDLAIATVQFSFNGNFFIVARDTTDSVSVGKLYKKEMENSIIRRAIFKKIANTDNPKRNWRLRRVSGSVTKSPDTNLAFDWIKVEASDGQEWTINEPLSFITDLDSIPLLNPGEIVKVTVKLNETSSKPDTLVLRYRTNRMHRARKAFQDNGEGVDEAANDGIYTGQWTVGQRRGIFHAFADAFDEGSIKDDAAPYNALAWGFPYFVKR